MTNTTITKLGHYGIQGRICPVVTIHRDDGAFTVMITPLKIDIRQTVKEGGFDIFQPRMIWNYDVKKKTWQPPAYSPATVENTQLCEELLIASHALLDSPEGIEKMAEAKGYVDESTLATNAPRTAFTMILGVASAHFKADETTATGQDYMARRHSRPVDRQAGPRKSTPGAFVPDLSAVP